jgi:hypothetical protein
VLLAELTNIWPGIWWDPEIGSAGRGELPEFRSDLSEDGAPVADSRLPEEPGAPVPGVSVARASSATRGPLPGRSRSAGRALQRDARLRCPRLTCTPRRMIN